MAAPDLAPTIGVTEGMWLRFCMMKKNMRVGGEKYLRFRRPTHIFVIQKKTTMKISIKLTKKQLVAALGAGVREIAIANGAGFQRQNAAHK